MSPVAAPADRRFHRARVKPGRRRSWWTFLKPAITGAGVVLVNTVGKKKPEKSMTVEASPARALKVAG